MYNKKRYIHDGREYSGGDSVMVLYKKKKNLSGIISGVRRFEGKIIQYRIHHSPIWYAPKRVKGIRMMLTEKQVKAYDDKNDRNKNIEFFLNHNTHIHRLVGLSAIHNI